MTKHFFEFISIMILTAACTVHPQSDTPPPASGDLGPVVKYDISQCPPMTGKFFRPGGGSGQVSITKLGTTLKVRDRGVDFQIDGHQYAMQGGSFYIGTCFQNSIRIMIKNQVDNKNSDDMILYTPSKMGKTGMDRGIFEDGKPSDIATFIPFVES